MTNALARKGVKKNTMGGAEPRIAGDAYYTPYALARAICRRMHKVIGEPNLIIEPSSGNGVFIKASRDTWGAAPTIHAIEPYPEHDGVFEGANIISVARWEDDVLQRTAPDTWSPNRKILILGNPPYDIDEGPSVAGERITAEQHVVLAMKRLHHRESSGPQPRWLCFLLRQAFRATKNRYERLYSPRGLGGLRYVWDVVGRPSYTGHIPKALRGSKSTTESAEYNVMVWQAGYRGIIEQGWIEWQD